ncbi:MAG: NAD(P)H dehydrogenase [Shewanella sp.]|nr:NAD(P)H-dependent oxidoreductase [Shewanella sp.]PHQ75168.1 MAG: NAD(P)H dehydrogenase [Shewanella sp.]
MNVLLIDGHPDLNQSTANAVILKHYKQNTTWTINHLGGRALNLPEEQAALLIADVVIIQFPLYWSSFPAILKNWVDDVFTFNFAFGPNGSLLKNKKLVFSITAGAKEDSYAKNGFNLMPIEDYQRAFEHVFRTAEMDIVDTILTFEMNADPNEGGNQSSCVQLANNHAKTVMSCISLLK